MSKDLPKISLITPSFNQAQFLEATIQSVISQSYPNLEYIIIDGGSTDGSLEIIKKYENYFHFWCSEPDGGQYDAINKGFSHSTGEIMAWINSDDMYFVWTLKTVASIMYELPQVEWLTSLNPGLWDSQGFCLGLRSVAGYSQESFLDGHFLPSRGCIQQESTFWKRSLWEKAGGHISTQYKLAGDFELWSRFYLYSELFASTSPLGGFRYHKNQRSYQNQEDYLVEAKEALSTMRYRCNWTPNYLRGLAKRLKLNKMPIFRQFIDKMYGYTGKIILKKDLYLPDTNWNLECYKFYC
jgi:glycosyltransferase involved in cell wall biosynthesis